MEYEYKDPARRSGKIIVVVGIILALAAGAAAFYLIYQARQQAGQATMELVPVVVAKQQIPARKPIEAADVELRQVPADATNELGVFTDPAKVIGLIPTVTILAGQPVYANFLASQAVGGQFSILEPGETVGPDSEAWRAVSLTIPDDRAVGGLVNAGSIVDVFLTATITVPDALVAEGVFTTGQSTKITYQNIKILERASSFYVVRVSLAVAEEISHLQATGTTSFSLALRPTEDNRSIDVSRLGATSNLIIQRYGLPIPRVYPGTGPLPTAPPIEPSPSPSGVPVAPSASPAP
jgi:Flp pilus assembly protein CpaB